MSVNLGFPDEDAANESAPGDCRSLRRAVSALPAAPPPRRARRPAPAVTYADARRPLVESSTVWSCGRGSQDGAGRGRPRAPGVAHRPGRLYIEARTLGVLCGHAPGGPGVAFLADMPLDADGKPPKLTKQRLLLFADSAPRQTGHVAVGRARCASLQRAILTTNWCGPSLPRWQHPMRPARERRA